MANRKSRKLPKEQVQATKEIVASVAKEGGQFFPEVLQAIVSVPSEQFTSEVTDIAAEAPIVMEGTDLTANVTAALTKAYDKALSDKHDYLWLEIEEQVTAWLVDQNTKGKAPVKMELPAIIKAMLALASYKPNLSAKAQKDKPDDVIAFRSKESGAFVQAVRLASKVAMLRRDKFYEVTLGADGYLQAPYSQVNPASLVKSDSLVRVTTGDVNSAYTFHYVQDGATGVASQTAADKIAKVVANSVKEDSATETPNPLAFTNVAKALPAQAIAAVNRGSPTATLAVVLGMLKDGSAAATWDAQAVKVMDEICNLWLDTVKEQIADKALAHMAKVDAKRDAAKADMLRKVG